jgi:lipoprotein-releasing system permease protein
LVAQVFFNVGTVDLNGAGERHRCDGEIRYYNFATTWCRATRTTWPRGNNTMVLGKGLADMMACGIGDMVQVSTAAATAPCCGDRASSRAASPTIDKVTVLRQHQDRAEAAGRPRSYYTDINVKLKDLAMAPPWPRSSCAPLRCGRRGHPDRQRAVRDRQHVRSIISYAVGVVLLIVAGFGIYNILNMMIYEKLDSHRHPQGHGLQRRRCARHLHLAQPGHRRGAAAPGLLLGALMQNGIDSIPFITAHCPR